MDFTNPAGVVADVAGGGAWANRAVALTHRASSLNDDGLPGAVTAQTGVRFSQKIFACAPADWAIDNIPRLGVGYALFSGRPGNEHRLSTCFIGL